MHRMVHRWGGHRSASASASSPYLVLLNDLLLIPVWHYLVALLAICFAFLYHFLEFHFLHDLFTGFRGCSVALTYHSSSRIYHDVVSKCRILQSRYLVTPWLSSPHLQTVFLSLFGRPPVFNYRRELFHLSDGGTIALDWLLDSDVLGSNYDTTSAIPKDDIKPIVLAIPGCLMLRCLGPSCGAAVGQDMIIIFACDDDKRKYSMYLLRSFVEDNKKTKWCPAPGCEHTVNYVGDNENIDVSCLCSYDFCWNCTEETHRPVDCNTVRLWILKNSAESENMNWYILHSQSGTRLAHWQRM